MSVLLPVYAGEAFLRPAIDAILAQTFHDFELLVVDDASPDRSAELVASYDDPRVVFIRNERNQGQTASMQIALERARGEFIARQDQDDISLPLRLARLVEEFDRRPDIGVLGTECAVIDLQGELVPGLSVSYGLETPVQMAWRLLWADRLVDSSVMFRAEAARRVGGFDRRLRFAQDYALWLRLSHEVGVARLPEVLLHLRVHVGSASSRFAAAQAVEVDVTIQGALSQVLGRPVSIELAAGVNRAVADGPASREDVRETALIMSLSVEPFARARHLGIRDRADVRLALAESLVKLATRHRAVLGLGTVRLLFCALRACPGAFIRPAVLRSWWKQRQQSLRYRRAVAMLWGTP